MAWPRVSRFALVFNHRLAQTEPRPTARFRAWATKPLGQIGSRPHWHRAHSIQRP